jgi:glycosyltransferase involved in cell wall biosynthesis
MMLSIVTPAFNEASNLDALYARLVTVMGGLGLDWEWLVVDDHSPDGTFACLERLAALDPRVRGLRLARNGGSHVAITCGLHHARGDAAVMMAADLQDPPETLGAMVEKWRAGAQVVWATRRSRPGDRGHSWFAAVYYWTMRKVVGLPEIPARGADFFLADRMVLDAFRRLNERNVSVFASITALGFRQEYVEYDKLARTSGQSGWTLARKVKLVVDSVTAFSAFPIRLCSLAGLTFLGVAVLIGGVAIWAPPAPGGGTRIVLAVMFGLTGVQMLALGLVGEYVWRSLDESRRRPVYLVEAAAGQPVATIE